VIIALAEALLLSKKHKEALPYINEAIELSEKLKTPDSEAEAYILRSFYYSIAGNNGEALRDLSKSYKIWERSYHICRIRWLILLREKLKKLYKLPPIYNFEKFLETHKTVTL
jgi:tetratricopeptide (TPR) repeat protein